MKPRKGHNGRFSNNDTSRVPNPSVLFGEDAMPDNNNKNSRPASHPGSARPSLHGRPSSSSSGSSSRPSPSAYFPPVPGSGRNSPLVGGNGYFPPSTPGSNRSSPSPSLNNYSRPGGNTSPSLYDFPQRSSFLPQLGPLSNSPLFNLGLGSASSPGEEEPAPIYGRGLWPHKTKREKQANLGFAGSTQELLAIYRRRLQDKSPTWNGYNMRGEPAQHPLPAILPSYPGLTMTAPPNARNPPKRRLGNQYPQVPDLFDTRGYTAANGPRPAPWTRTLKMMSIAGPNTNGDWQPGEPIPNEWAYDKMIEEEKFAKTRREHPGWTCCNSPNCKFNGGEARCDADDEGGIRKKWRAREIWNTFGANPKTTPATRPSASGPIYDQRGYTSKKGEQPAPWTLSFIGGDGGVVYPARFPDWKEGDPYPEPVAAAHRENLAEYEQMKNNDPVKSKCCDNTTCPYNGGSGFCAAYNPGNAYVAPWLR